jgi:hypothetical protein
MFTVRLICLPKCSCWTSYSNVIVPRGARRFRVQGFRAAAALHENIPKDPRLLNDNSNHNCHEDDFTTNRFMMASNDETMNATGVVVLPYHQNPAISATALAHALWGYILQPGVDSAIDATCGNGGDSVVIAKLLFRKSKHQQASSSSSSSSQLICIDVQQQAIQNTKERLIQHMLPLDNLHFYQVSHEVLPHINTNSLALVAYNLGYLPGSFPQKQKVQTCTTSTLASLTEAAQRIRIGGMISVISYPRTNPQEDTAVRAYMQSLAKLSLKRINPEQLDKTDQQLQQQQQQQQQQTWRVQEHTTLGWTDAPILRTATRIK